MLATKVAMAMRALARAQVKEKMAAIKGNAARVLDDVKHNKGCGANIPLDVEAVFEIEMLRYVASAGDATIHSLIENTYVRAIEALTLSDTDGLVVPPLIAVLRNQTTDLRNAGLNLLAETWEAVLSQYDGGQSKDKAA